MSEANNRANLGTPVFGHADSPLTEAGYEQAALLGDRLISEYNINPSETPVATSLLRRAQETALGAGFTRLSLRPLLNEVRLDIRYGELRRYISNDTPPAEAIAAANALLEQPPVEPIWVTHGMLIGALCRVLNQHQEARFIPRYCEIRELQLL